MLGMAASVHQCRSVGLPVHDSRGSKVGIVHLTFIPYAVVFISKHSLSPNVLPVGGILCRDEDQMAQAWASGVLLQRVLSVVVAKGNE
jgi:hypothetical protein